MDEKGYLVMLKSNLTLEDSRYHIFQEHSALSVLSG